MSTLLFDHVAEALERSTPLDKLEARGTLRLALKAAGLDPRILSADQARVVLEKLMPAELEARGVDGAGEVCRKLVAGLEGVADSIDPETDLPESIFARLAGSS